MKKTLVMEAIQRIYPSYYGGYIDTTAEFNWGNIRLESGDLSLIDKDLVEAKISEIAIEVALQKLRMQRNQLLAQSDWRATVDYPGSNQAAWLTYRQNLRDLPANSTPSLDDNGQLTGVTWPTPPE
jgi:hypothetical protein